MSNAKKCDVCGTFYMHPYKRRIRITNEQYYLDPRNYDLCDQCYEKLCEFLHEETDPVYYRKEEDT